MTSSILSYGIGRRKSAVAQVFIYVSASESLNDENLKSDEIKIFINKKKISHYFQNDLNAIQRIQKFFKIAANTKSVAERQNDGFRLQTTKQKAMSEHQSVSETSKAMEKRWKSDGKAMSKHPKTSQNIPKHPKTSQNIPEHQSVSETSKSAAKLHSLTTIINVSGGGTTGQKDAICLALGKAFYKIVPNLKKQNPQLLTQDARVKERKKYGLKKARKAPQYSKR